MSLSAVLKAADRLNKCIASTSFGGELLLVDSGRTEQTLAIANRLGAWMATLEWLRFAAQKQFAVSATSYHMLISLSQAAP